MLVRVCQTMPFLPINIAGFMHDLFRYLLAWCTIGNGTIPLLAFYEPLCHQKSSNHLYHFLFYATFYLQHLPTYVLILGCGIFIILVRVLGSRFSPH